MKKTLLLSVVASTMIMAGGDIAPVEPAVETPAPAVSGWEFSGQAALYYQTKSYEVGSYEYGDLFDQESSAADAGIQLRAVNADLYNGIGAGVEVSGLATFDLEKSVVSDVMQGFGGTEDLDGGWISQMYLTYGFDNTSFKVGRQELPKALSPFAFSEDWNVFKNTYDAVLVVNSDIPNTTLVGAWVRSANQNGYGVWGSDMNSFEELNGDHGVFMLTAQNKSIENLTLTGSWYYSNEYLTTNDLNILWGDAQYNFMENYNVAIQGGTVMHDDIDETEAFGAKVEGKFSMVNAMLAYSHVNESSFGVFNVGGTSSALYTDLVWAEQASWSHNDRDAYALKANMNALSGNVSAALGYNEMGDNGMWGIDSLTEFNIGYSTELTDGLTVGAQYAYTTSEGDMIDDEELNIIRVIGRYNF